MRVRISYYIWVGIVHAFIILLAFLLFGKEKPVWLLFSEVFVFVSLLFSFFLLGRINRPVDIMRRGLSLLSEEDFTTTIAKVGYKDVDELIAIFNSMIIKLREKKLAVRNQNQFLDLLIESSPMGLIITDFDNKILIMNPAVKALLDIEQCSENMLISALPQYITAEICRMDYGDKRTITRGTKKLLCRKSYFYDKGFKHPFYSFEEMTAEIRKAEKDTYRKLIRVLAHEVNNTISSVNSILTEIRNSSEIIENSERDETVEILRVAIDRNSLLINFMQAFSNVVKIPDPSRKLYPLNESVSNIIESYSLRCKERGIRLINKLHNPSPTIYADRSQIEQVIENIIKNSIESIQCSGGEIIIQTQSKPACLIIKDNGSGIAEDIKENLFTPFFTTKSFGQGIGLTLVGEILNNHNFQYDLRTIENYTVFKIMFQ